MKRKGNLFASLAFLLITTPLLVSQRAQDKPNPTPPSDVLGPQLIAWSQVQKPQPVTQQSEQSANTTQTPPQQPPAEQTVTGTIFKDGSRFVVKVSGGVTYELDDQQRAKKYEGKQVKIGGTLDANGGSLHIISIELLS